MPKSTNSNSGSLKQIPFDLCYKMCFLSGMACNNSRFNNLTVVDQRDIVRLGLIASKQGFLRFSDFSRLDRRVLVGGMLTKKLKGLIVGGYVVKTRSKKYALSKQFRAHYGKYLLTEKGLAVYNQYLSELSCLCEEYGFMFDRSGTIEL